MRRGVVLRWSVFLLSFASLCTQAVSADGGAPPLKSDSPLHSALDRAVATEATGFFGTGYHVGLSLAVVSRGATYYYDYGATTRGGAALPGNRSVYEIASVTKVFTAALAAKAVVNHRMVLDGDFRSYLPGSYRTWRRMATRSRCGGSGGVVSEPAGRLCAAYQ
jgi:CubicO group peptidase (beta-lactamase class C family)